MAFLPQRSLSNTEDECTHLKEMSERSQEELRELANKYNAAVNEIKELTDKIKVRAAGLHFDKCYITISLSVASQHGDERVRYF